MDTLEIGKKLVELCREGKNEEAVNTLLADEVVSVEGIEGVRGKGAWWRENHEIHSAKVEGPWPNGDKFIVRFTYEVTFKPQNMRFTMEEAALYTVANGKIVKEEFFYNMG
jgi:hypothetical protein